MKGSPETRAKCAAKTVTTDQKESPVKKKSKPGSKRPTTALARRPATKTTIRSKTALVRKEPTPVAVLPVLDQNLLGEEASLGALGLVEVKLSDREEAVLSKPVDAGDVRMKPTGQPYLSHPSYTRWFSEAFGRLGWAIVPRAKAVFNGKTVVQPYILFIHGQPAAFAYGEQEYHENNKEQTYGDAVEATVASALRRCAKRLGVGLELWDKRWLDAWTEQFCVKVWLTDKDKPVWRRKDDPPFWNEATSRTRGAQGGPPPRSERARPERPAASHPKGDEPITHDQVMRFWTIARRAGRSDEEVKTFLKRHYNLDSSKAMLRKDYENVVKAIEHPGPLLPVLDIEREPGEDG